MHMNSSLLNHFRKAAIGLVAILASIVTLIPVLAAQSPDRSGVDAQREAMHKLAFLSGRWTGPITVFRGPGEPLHLTQTEVVEYKLDGLVLLIEGKSTSSDGKVLISALATVSYDEDSKGYRIRAYNGGHYVDSELSVSSSGFLWGFTAGPVRIINTMQLTAKGEWNENTEAVFGTNPPRHSMGMLLHPQP